MRFSFNHKWTVCVTPKFPKGCLKTRIFTFGVAFHIFFAGNCGHFKFGVWVEHSKSQPTDDQPFLKWAWLRHVTYFKFLVPLIQGDISPTKGAWLWSCDCFYPRGASDALVLAVIMCLCVCLSVTRWCCIKTAKRRITKTTPRYSPGTQVFWHQQLSVGDPTISSEICVQSDHPFSSTTISTNIRS